MDYLSLLFFFLGGGGGGGGGKGYIYSFYGALIICTHSREIETLHYFNGKYMGYCLKFRKRQRAFEFPRNAYEFNKILLEMITG